MFGRERCRGGRFEVSVSGRRRVGVAPAEVRASGPPIAARDPDAAREIVGMDVEGGMEGWEAFKEEVGGWVIVVRKPARLRAERSMGGKRVGGMVEAVG